MSSCVYKLQRCFFFLSPVLISKYIIFSGEDGRSRAELLMLILRQIDQFVFSPVEYQRKRGCLAVHEMLLKFRMVCVSGYCALGSHGNSAHTKQIDRTLYGNFSKLPCKYVPSENFEFFILIIYYSRYNCMPVGLGY